MKSTYAKLSLSAAFLSLGAMAAAANSNIEPQKNTVSQDLIQLAQAGGGTGGGAGSSGSAGSGNDGSGGSSAPQGTGTPLSGTQTVPEQPAAGTSRPVRPGETPTNNPPSR
jgi:hypothetical protein